MRTKARVFKQNLKYKLPVFGIVATLIWFGSGALGFPKWWQIEFVAFAFVGLLLFILLDLPALQPESRPSQSTSRVLAAYALPTLLFISLTAELPQFDPKYEIFPRPHDPPNLGGLDSEEVIQVGRNIFESNKCFNCHRVFWEGNSDRGPNLGTKQIGLYTREYIKEQIIDPRKKQSPGFDDPKSRTAMPDYYGEDLSDQELDALVAYLKTLRDPTHIPVEGKLGSQWTWWDDPQIVFEGKKVYEGLEPATEGLNCAVCHGKTGIPMMTGALDFRDPNWPDTDKMADHSNVTLKDFPDSLYYKRVTRGIDGTPMGPWGTIYPHLYLWKAEAYARTFHDPLYTRTAKKAIPPVPTKEEIERWQKEGLFMDPLL